MGKRTRKEENRIIAQHLKLSASQFRLIEMHCEIAFPNIEQANTQGSIRDALRSIAQSMVAIAEIVENR